MFRVSKFEKFDGRAVLGDECDADTVGEAVRGNQDFAACKLGGEVTLIHPQGSIKDTQSGGIIRMHALRPWRARALCVLLHGTGTGTADEPTCVNNHRPSIFLASTSRSTWLLAVQNGWPG